MVRQPLNNVYKLQNGLKVLCSYSGCPVRDSTKGTAWRNKETCATCTSYRLQPEHVNCKIHGMGYFSELFEMERTFHGGIEVTEQKWHPNRLTKACSAPVAHVLKHFTTSALELGQCFIIKLDMRQEMHCACRCQSVFNKLVLLLTLEVFYALPVVT